MIAIQDVPKDRMRINPEWEPQGIFIKPNSEVELDEYHLKEFLHWVHERQEVWHKRTVLGQPAPWTKDPVIRELRFTHPFRDIDRVSIRYRNDVLSDLEDNYKSKVNLLFNTMLFRIFNNEATFDILGKADVFEDDREEWVADAREKLKGMHDRGERIFTGSYVVYAMVSIRPVYGLDMKGSKKYDNAMLTVDYLWKNIEKIYKEGVEEADTMKKQLAVFEALPGIGFFNAYEWCCDLCMAERYEGIKVLQFDDDSDLNVGPGANRGIRLIYKNLGNFTPHQALVYLAAVAPYYFEELGYEETMKYPEGRDTLLLRDIEHSSCEYQKYERFKRTGKQGRRYKYEQ